VSACAWTSSTGCGVGFLAETATFIFNFLLGDQALDGAETA
jgi:hypothetical protein